MQGCLRKLQVTFLANFEDLKTILATLYKLQRNELKNLISKEE